MPSPPLEHVLSVCPADARVAMDFGFGWQQRISDTYRAWALRHVLADQAGRLLDYGCGAKPYANLAHPGITSWYGVDVDVRTSGAEYTNRADVFLEDGRIPLPDDSFDVALATQVLEHVEDLGLALDELLRVLRPGGTLIATCPHTSPLHEEPFDFRRFTPYGIRVDGARHGFGLTRAIALGGPISTIATLMAIYANPLRKIPLAGNLAHRAWIEAMTRGGAAFEAVAFRYGMRQCTLTTDFLFVLQSQKRARSAAA